MARSLKNLLLWSLMIEIMISLLPLTASQSLVDDNDPSHLVLDVVVDRTREVPLKKRSKREYPVIPGSPGFLSTRDIMQENQRRNQRIIHRVSSFGQHPASSYPFSSLSSSPGRFSWGSSSAAAAASSGSSFGNSHNLYNSMDHHRHQQDVNFSRVSSSFPGFSRNRFGSMMDNNNNLNINRNNRHLWDSDYSLMLKKKQIRGKKVVRQTG